MKKRNLIRLSLMAAIILCSSIIYLSCRKSTEEAAPEFDQPQAAAISKIKYWMADQKQFFAMNLQKRIDTLLTNADWEKSLETKASNGKSIFYIPVRSSELGLEFFYDIANQKIDSGNLVKVEGKKTSLKQPEIVAAKTYYETVVLHKEATKPFTGLIHCYSIVANFQYDYNFEEGKVISHSIVAPRLKKQTIKKANGLKTNSMVCEEWGFYIIWEYAPPTLVYTFWVCTGMPDCPPASSLAISIGSSKQYVGVNCATPPPNSGSPSGGGVQDENCNFDIETANKIISEFQPESLPYTGGLEYSNEVQDQITGYTEKEWTPIGGSWNFFKTILPPYFVITYGAFYGGTVYKNSATDFWKYKTVKYLYSEKVSGMVPPCASLEVTVTDLGSTISQDKRTASSKIHWHATLRITCLAGTQVGDDKSSDAEAKWGTAQ